MTARRGPGFLLLVVLCAVSFAGGYYFHHWHTFLRSSYRVKVVGILDGDTFDVEWFGGVARVRVVGIDTFETTKNKKLAEQAAQWKLSVDRALALGKQAKGLAEMRLLGQTVTIKFPKGRIERESFGRLLAYVYLGKVDFGKYLLEEGLAYARPEDHVREKYYQWPMIQAKNDKKGMFAGPS